MDFEKEKTTANNCRGVSLCQARPRRPGNVWKIIASPNALCLCDNDGGKEQQQHINT